MNIDSYQVFSNLDLNKKIEKKIILYIYLL